MDESTNGKAATSLTKEALADRSRFQFKEDTLDLTEYISGVNLILKSLTVAEREALPDLTKKDAQGKDVADVTIPKLASIFAAVVDAVVVDGQKGPGLSAEEAAEFLGDWPGEALDAVIEKFGEMTGTGEEKSAAAGTFPEK